MSYAFYPHQALDIDNMGPIRLPFRDNGTTRSVFLWEKYTARDMHLAFAAGYELGNVCYWTKTHNLFYFFKTVTLAQS